MNSLNDKRNKNDWVMIISCLLLMISVFGFPDVSKFAYITRFLFIIAYFFSYFIRSPKLELRYFMWATIISIWGLINLAVSYDFSKTFLVYITMLQAIWIGCFIYDWMRKSGNCTVVFMSVIFSALLLCFRLLRHLDLGRFGTRKIGMMLGVNVNALGFRIAIAFILLLTLTFQNKGRKNIRILCVVGDVILIAFVLITGSRRALIICFVGVVILSLGFAQNFTKTVKAILIIVIVTIVLYQLLTKIPELYNIIGKRMEIFISSFFSGGDYLDGGRDVMLNTAVKLFWERPLFGWGMGNFREISGINNAYAHNTFAELLYAFGLPGLLLYYSFFLIVIKKLFRLDRKTKSIGIVLIMTSLISDFASVNFSSIVSHFLLAIIVFVSFDNMRYGFDVSY